MAAPDTPTDLPKRSWKDTLKRTFTEFKEDNLTDWAAALTYYAVQALFPALLALFSIVGLLGASTTNALIDNVNAAAPGPARDIVVPAIENLQSNQGAAGLLLVVGLVIALFSASSYIGAFSRASNAIYEVPEGRPLWKLRPQQMGIAFVRVPVLGGAERQAAPLPLAEPGRPARRRDLDRGLGGVHALRRELRQLQTRPTARSAARSRSWSGCG